MILVGFLAAPLAIVYVELCSPSPGPQVAGPPEWQWRIIDGRKCWFLKRQARKDDEDRPRRK